MTYIQFPVAKNQHGDHIKIADAIKTDQYFCLGCDELLIPVNIDNPHKIQTPHFRHKEQNISCHWEKALQEAFKIEANKILLQHFQKKTPLEIRYECNYCHEIHSGNLLKKTSKIELDFVLDENITIPIALLDSNDNCYSAIHFVVKNLFQPTAKQRYFYEDRGIRFIQYNLHSFQDFEDILIALALPNVVDFCLKPSCKKCGRKLETKELIIRVSECWQCESPMKVCYIRERFEYILPSEFTEIEIQKAKEKGVLLEKRYSNTLGRKYLACICPHCNTYYGEYFLEDEIIDVSEDEEIFEMYYCPDCEE